MAITDSFIIHTEKCYFVGIGIRGYDLHEKAQKLVSQEN